MWRCRSSLFIRLTGPTPVSAYIYLYIYMYTICTPTPVITYIFIYIYLYIIYVTQCKTLSPVRIQPTSKIQHQTMNIAKPRGPRAPPPQGGCPRISSRPSSESERRPSIIEIRKSSSIALRHRSHHHHRQHGDWNRVRNTPYRHMFHRKFSLNIAVFVQSLLLIDAWWRQLQSDCKSGWEWSDLNPAIILHNSYRIDAQNQWAQINQSWMIE